MIETDSREQTIQRMVGSLEAVRKDAVYAKMDHHFISDIDHLIATAEANKEEGDDL